MSCWQRVCGRNGGEAGGCAGLRGWGHPHAQLPGQLPQAHRRISDVTLEPDVIVTEGLAALGTGRVSYPVHSTVYPASSCGTCSPGRRPYNLWEMFYEACMFT